MRILTLLFLFLSNPLFASFQMNERMQQSYTHIINLEFEAANHLLHIEQIEHPDNAILFLHHNYIDFLTVLIGEEEKFFSTAKDLKSDRIDFIQQGDDSSPYYLYAQAEVHLQWAFARLKFEEYLTAAYEIQKAYSLLEKNQEQFPDFKLNLKGLGLLHTLVGAIPEKYQWVIKLVGMEGSVELGLSELKSLLKDEEMGLYHSEILFLTAFLQLNMTNDEIAYKQLLDDIGSKYSDNYLLNFAAARLSHALGENDLCVKVLENRPTIQGKLSFHYLDYLLGMSYLYKLEYEKSKVYFTLFLSNFKGNNYIKSAYHKLAWIFFLQGEDNNYFELVKAKGIASIDEDKVALKEANSAIKNKYHTCSRLLRTRLLYDGGYYDEALLEISSVKILKKYSGFYDEYWYRLARIKSKLNYEDVVVITNYQKSYDLGIADNQSTNYYAPMSALQIGLIYEKQNKFNQAKIYFEKCLSLSDFDYERGIHQKAKVGLVRVTN
jgi:tetratricopeptide (TPR) repeat protein